MGGLGVGVMAAETGLWCRRALGAPKKACASSGWPGLAWGRDGSLLQDDLEMPLSSWTQPFPLPREECAASLPPGPRLFHIRLFGCSCHMSSGQRNQKQHMGYVPREEKFWKRG